MNPLDYIIAIAAIAFLGFMVLYGIGCILYAIVLLGKGIEAGFQRLSNRRRVL